MNKKSLFLAAAATLFSCASYAANYVIKLEVNGLSQYSQAGFDANGLHRETGTEYDLEGYNDEGLNNEGFGRNGLDSEGNRQVECHEYVGYYFYYNREIEMPGANYYAQIKYYPRQGGSDKYLTIVWNDVDVASDYARYRSYWPSGAQEYLATEFEADGYLYTYPEMISGYSPSSVYSKTNYSVCRTKI